MLGILLFLLAVLSLPVSGITYGIAVRSDRRYRLQNLIINITKIDAKIGLVVPLSCEGRILRTLYPLGGSAGTELGKASRHNSPFPDGRREGLKTTAHRRPPLRWPRQILPINNLILPLGPLRCLDSTVHYSLVGSREFRSLCDLSRFSCDLCLCR